MTAAANAAVEAAAGAVTANVVKAAANAVAKVAAVVVNVVSAEVGAVAVSVPTSPKRAARSKPAAPAAPMNAARVPRPGASCAVKVATGVAARVAVNLAENLAVNLEQTAVADRAPSVNRVDPPQPMTPQPSSTRQRRSRRSWTPFRVPKRWTQARPEKAPDVAVVDAADVIGTSRVQAIRRLPERPAAKRVSRARPRRSPLQRSRATAMR